MICRMMALLGGIVILGNLISCGDEKSFTSAVPARAAPAPADEVVVEPEPMAAEAKPLRAEAKLVFDREQTTSDAVRITETIMPAAAEQVLTVAQNDKLLDLLVVIDNSASMSEEQANLKNKLQPLIASFTDSNWQIAVVTTNEFFDQGCFRGLITSQDHDKNQLFAKAIAAGTDASGDEMGFRNALVGLQGGCPGQSPWVREGSFVSVLFVSDEDNCSNGVCADGIDWRNELETHLRAIRSFGETARIYGIIVDDSKPCQGAYNPGKTYLAAIEASGGHSGNICQANYGATLKAISADVAKMLNREISLKQAVISESLKVLVAGNEWTGWEYDDGSNRIVFSEVPPAKADIKVSFQPEEPPAIAFSYEFTTLPDWDSIRLSLAGQPVPAGQWQIDQDAGQLKATLYAAEPSELVLAFNGQWQPAAAFFLQPNLVINDLTVLWGEPLEARDVNYSWDAAAGVITLDPPPPAGVAVRFEVQVASDLPPNH